jgi:hypothetical protein
MEALCLSPDLTFPAEKRLTAEIFKWPWQGRGWKIYSQLAPRGLYSQFGVVKNNL